MAPLIALLALAVLVGAVRLVVGPGLWLVSKTRRDDEETR